MIDPGDLLEEAESLLRATATEVRRRTIVSRAYYAAFHFIRWHPCADTYSYSGRGGMHKDFLQWLSKSENRNVVFAGRILGDLHGLRTRADYDLRANLPQNAETDATEKARYIFEEALVEFDARG